MLKWLLMKIQKSLKLPIQNKKFDLLFTFLAFFNLFEILFKKKKIMHDAFQTFCIGLCTYFGFNKLCFEKLWYKYGISTVKCL